MVTRLVESECPLALSIIHDGEQIIGQWWYRSILFDTAAIQRLTGHLLALLTASIDSQQTIATMPLLTTAERHELLETWNQTATSYPTDHCLHQLITAQAQHTPEATAVVFEDQVLTYRELDEKSNQLARYLQTLGVQADQFVGLYVERSLEMIIGLLGILKAGGAYLPLDPAFPDERIRFMLDDAQTSIVLTQETLAADLATSQVQVVCLDNAGAQVAQFPQQPAPLTHVQPTNLAYIIYTSGSTGKPKGVQITHRSVVNFLSTMQQRPSLGKDDTLLAVTTIAFDIAVLELYLPLIVGAKVVIASRAATTDGDALQQLLETGVTAMQATPATWQLLLATNWAGNPHLKILCGGEAMPQALAQALLTRGASVWNLYGPTEATVWSTIYQVTPSTEADQKPVLIGRPIGNTHTYILDETLQPTPIGVPGELYIGGDGLARGYLNRPALTAERFISHPFKQEERVYKTGDLARYLPDGNIEFLGRLDHQVKLRGYRIELGEIESALSQDATVHECAVLLREDAPNDKRLVAYITTRKEEIDSEANALQTEHVSQWKAIYDNWYVHPSKQVDPTFNINGWNSSYTGQPIPEAEMREWVNTTVTRIASWHPQQILEIGCGTGLLLFRLAPACQRYMGIDVSELALAHIQAQIERAPDTYGQVSLQIGRADALSHLTDSQFDTVILNSVVQYFPNADYLVAVLSQAVQCVKPGGRIFVGDVRNLLLLEAFHASVQYARGAKDISPQALHRLVQARVEQEKELVIAPAFFDKLKRHLPQIGHVQILPKRGTSENEMTRFRYDVVLHIASSESSSRPQTDMVWFDGNAQQATLESLRQWLQSTTADLAAVKGVANGRLTQEKQLLMWLAGQESTIESQQTAAGVEIEPLFKLGAELGYDVTLSWADTDAQGSFNVLFSKTAHMDAELPFISLPATQGDINQPWSAYTNAPLQQQVFTQMEARLRNHLQKVLPAYMIPAHFVVLSQMPLTPNRKIDRKGLPPPKQLQSQRAFVAPTTEIEADVAQVWAQVLGLERVGVQDNIFELGAHSLLVTQIVSRLRHQYPVPLSVRTIFEHPTVAELATYLQTAAPQNRAETPSLQPIPRTPTLPLSYAQRRLWFLEGLGNQDNTYNIPLAFYLRGEVDVAAFENALMALLQRHESLRTTFVTINGQPATHIAEIPTIQLEKIDLQTLPLEIRQAEAEKQVYAQAQRPFVLTQEPLVRMALFQLDAATYLFSWVTHHIISDGWSEFVLLEELSHLYTALTTDQPATLPALTIQYADFAHWQEVWLAEAVEPQLAYWGQQLAGAPTLLELPMDRHRPPIMHSAGQTERLAIPAELTRQLRHLSQQSGNTLYMTLLTAFYVFLHRYSGQEDILIGSPIANRHHRELEPLIGFFINTLVLRATIHDGMTWAELLAQVRQTAVDGYANQDAPFDKVVERLQPERNLSYSPLFQIMFDFQESINDKLRLPNVKAELLEIERTTAMFDLTLTIKEQTDQLYAEWEYRTDLFETTTIQRMAQHFITLLRHIASAGAQTTPITRLALLAEAEQQHLLYEWNQTNTDFAQRDVPVHRLIEAQAERTPTATAVTFMGQSLTYAELNQRANQLAHYLRELPLGPHPLIGIYLERSVEPVVAVLAVLKLGAAYLPIDPMYPPERVSFMLADAQVALLLTQTTLRTTLSDVSAELICLDTIALQQHNTHNLPHEPQGEQIAYTIYTSGSTGKPKGVQITHRSLTNAYWAWEQAYELTSRTQSHLQMASISFDVFTGDFVRALCSGCKLVLCPRDFLLDPPALYQLMRDEQIDCAEFVPAVIRQLTAYLEQTSQDLHFFKLVVVSSDNWFVAEYENLMRFCGPDTYLINSYGVTEATVDSTYFTGTDLQLLANRSVPIGRPMANTQIYILDQHLQPTPIGIPGELYIGGVGVGAGYINRPDLTAVKFIPNPFDTGHLYRTGDLACYLSDGNIEFLGRADNQIKIRGFRIELGEIESVLVQHPAVHAAVVLAPTDSTIGTYLVAYIVAKETAEQPPSAQLRDFLKENLPDYMVPAYYVWLDAFPLTPNGKINRRALPAPDESQQVRQQQYIAPSTATETALAKIWGDVLNLQQIGRHDHFFALGGHSLLVAQVIARIREQFSVDLPVRNLFELPTLAALSLHIEQQQPLDGTHQQMGGIPRLPSDAPRTLSFAQQRLWFLDKLDQGTPHYNICTTLGLEGKLDLPTLQQSIDQLVARHETLRTTFPEHNGEPTIEIASHLSIEMPLVSLEETPPEAHTATLEKIVREEAAHVFQLDQSPLLRLKLLRFGSQKHVLIMTLHHIISDGWSEEILIRELFALYEAQSKGVSANLIELPVRYTDYAQWQREQLQGDTLQTQLDYWQQQMAGAPSVLELPTDWVRPAEPNFEGRSHYFRIRPALTQKLQALGREAGTTLYMTLLSAFLTLLYRYSHQDDIVVGTPVGNRNDQELESVVGFFVNTLALRVNLGDTPSFSEVLRQVRQVTLDAYTHQDLPFEQLVDLLQPERSLSFNPLFQVMFAWQNEALEPLELPELTISQLPIKSTHVSFDLVLSIEESQAGLTGSWEYRVDLFTADTMQRFTAHFLNLLEAVVATPHKAIAQLPILSQAETHTLLTEWNKTALPNDWSEVSHLCMHQLFEQQVAQTPHHIAVSFAGQQLTYEALNQQANQLAHHLRALGVGPEKRVGICVERSIDMVVGVLAILKAGGAYVPADPSFPAERIAHIFADAAVLLILTQRPLREQMPTERVPLLYLDEAGDNHQYPSHNPANQTQPDNLIYVIYTSGSTGQPKGVLVPHKGVVNLALSIGRAINLSSADRLLQFLSLSFDVFALELFSAFLKGAAVVIHPNPTQLSTLDFSALCEAEAVTVLDLPVAFWQHWVEDLSQRHLALPSEVRVLLTGGESPSVSKIKLLANLAQKSLTFLCSYGPTEASITTTIYCQPAEMLQTADLTKLPLGYPLPNVQVYALDEWQQPVPIGVTGELHISGLGVARGYLNDLGRTQQKFIANPHGNEGYNRLYRTGDLVRYLSDGTLEFLGRKDNQVKIRGFRIELGEIESVLAQHAQIRQAAVIVHTNQHHNKRLVAYFVAQETAPDLGQLRHYLKDKLPDYMMPAAFIPLDALPVNTSGKINYRALPDPSHALEAATINFVAPRNETEQIIADIWSDMLDISPVGIYSNFFELGGHSLIAIQVTSRLQEAFNLDLSLRTLFEKPTVIELADWLATQQFETADDQMLTQLLDEIDTLSETDIEALLSDNEL